MNEAIIKLYIHKLRFKNSIYNDILYKINFNYYIGYSILLFNNNYNMEFKIPIHEKILYKFLTYIFYNFEQHSNHSHRLERL